MLIREAEIKINKGITRAGVYGHGTRQKRNFILGKHATIFQAEIYANKACAVENLDRNYINKKLYILSDTKLKCVSVCVCVCGWVGGRLG
jgi:hypothetical protein